MVMDAGEAVVGMEEEHLMDISQLEVEVQVLFTIPKIMKLLKNQI